MIFQATAAQYASAQITALAAVNGIARSMGYTGICWDNALVESFFATSQPRMETASNRGRSTMRRRLRSPHGLGPRKSSPRDLDEN